jgi:GxxExxY protein
MDHLGDSAKTDIRNFPGLSGDPEINLITEKVIGSAFTVLNSLGIGFLEKVYENALAHEIRKCGLSVAQQVDINVRYDQIIVGVYTADILVEEKVLVELKVVKALNEVHIAQCINYLHASGLSVCLLMNFAHTKLDFRRLVYNSH